MAGAVFEDSKHWLANTRRHRTHLDRPRRMMALAARPSYLTMLDIFNEALRQEQVLLKIMKKGLLQSMLSISAASGHA